MPCQPTVMRALRLLSCGLLAVAACDDAQGGDGRIGPDFHETFLDDPGAQAGGSGGGSTLPAPGNCAKLKLAMCDWMVRCSGVDRGQCEALTDALVCKADPLISPCAKATPFACGPWPAVCGGLDGVFDRSAPIQGCNRLAKALCSRKCMPTSASAIAQCTKDTSAELRCPDWLAIYPTFPQCLKAIPAWSCSADGAPEACNGVAAIPDP